MSHAFHPENIRLSDDARSVRIIDQTLLPNELRHIELSEPEELFDAIARLAVRGAPAIGIFAGFALYVVALHLFEGREDESFGEQDLEALQRKADYLSSSRPTAVNLSWALGRMMDVAGEHRGEPCGSVVSALRSEAEAIQQEDAAMCKAMAELGLSLIEDGWGLITHCNAGPLATSCYGTALGPMILGAERGMGFKVFADETRPLLQGARLTSYELDKAGVDVTLICDGMSSAVMKQGWVQACFVGADRVAANGDTANKIGTSNLAIVAKRYGVPFYVVCPSSTLDYECETGDDIPIELRSGEEIKTMFYQQAMAPDTVKCYNPSFDVTDNDLITAIITEKGICRAPFTESLAAIR